MEAFVCNVQKNASGRMHLFLPSRKKHPALPEGETVVLIEEERWTLSFRSIAVNTGWPVDTEKRVNHFYRKLGEWFPHAVGEGKSPKGCRVKFVKEGRYWRMTMPEG